MRIYILFVFFILSIDNINSQNIVNPKIWLFGYQIPERDTNTKDTGYFLESGLNIFDFKNSTLTKARISNALGTLSGNAYIYDSLDSLILYSNGSKIFNYKHRLIEGADSLCYAENWGDPSYGYYSDHYIGLFPHAIQILPSLKNKNQYYLISVYITGDTNNFYKLVYSIVDMSLNNGLGKMIVKEKPIAYGDFTEAITSTRHANGKDWWIIAREYTGTCYTLLLLDSNGIKVISKNQCEGFDLRDRDAGKRNFVNKFSWNGKMYASISFKGLELYDFDRCTGRLFNRREYEIPKNDSFMNFSVCFTRDDKLLYFNSNGKIYQLEIKNNSVEKVADYKLYFDTTTAGNVLPIPTLFGYMQLAPNNIIYIGSHNGSRHLSTIEYPDIIGMGCNVKQMSEKLLTWNVGLPVFPNYELGAMVCCTGVTLNTELARTDTTILTKATASGYQWVNCDSGFKAVINATSRFFKPSYTANYAAVLFDKDGCSDTSDCYLFEVHRSGIDDIDSKEISLFPIPAQNHLSIVGITNTKPLKYRIYNLMGRELITAETIKEINISLLSNGQYILKLINNNSNVVKRFEVRK